MSSVLCDLWSDCTCENVACGRCICLHTPSIAREFNFRQAKKASLNKKNHHCSVQDEGRQEFQLLFDCQSSCCSHLVDEDECVGFRDWFPCDFEG